MTSSRNYPRAAFLASVVFAGWPLSDALMKIAQDAGVSQGEILMIFGLGSMATIFLLSVFRGRLGDLRPHNKKGLVVLGLCQLVGFIFWMLALPRLPLANMYIVSFLTPMAVACLAAVFLKESLGWNRAFVIAAGFAGVVVAVNPSNLFQHIDSGLPYLFLFGNMAGSSIQMFLLRVVADKERSECVAFYPRVFLTLGGFVFCLVTGFTAITPWIFFVLCVSGALGGIGWNLLAQAYRHAPAAAVAPFQYSQMIWGALFGYLVWNDVPNAYLLCGSAIIIASGVTLIRHERRISRTMPRLD